MPRFALSRLLLFVVSAILLSTSFALAQGEDQTAPLRKATGGKWRIGYLEGGPYANYQRHLVALTAGLAQLGWITLPNGLPLSQLPDEKSFWAWLGDNAKSDYIEFVQDGFWSEGWDKSRRGEIKEDALRRLAAKHDLDLVLAMGTWAGQDLANSRHATPVMVLQSSDPVAAGIIESVSDSGRENVFAHCDPTRHIRQVRVFHDIVGFKRLGIAYEDSPSGKVYASIDGVRDICRQLDVELVECHIMTNIPDQSKVVDSIKRCHERLALEVDAMYITNSIGVTTKTLPELLVPFMDAKIPTFAQMGFEAVLNGALMSISEGDQKPVGLFYARTLAQILRGASPRSMPQEFADVTHLAVNLDTAARIGFKPSQSLMAAAVGVHDHELGNEQTIKKAQ